jgi:Protein of unknown function (DUF1878)
MKEEAKNRVWQRIYDLEFHQECLFEYVCAPDNNHFNMTILERNLSKKEVEGIFDFLDAARKNPSSANFGDFRRALDKLVPRFDGDPHFPEEVIGSLYEDEKSREVYAAFRKQGMISCASNDESQGKNLKDFDFEL